MRQRPTFRGFGFVLLMIILISMAAMLPRQGFADRISNQEFMTMLTQDKDQIDQVTIRQNSQGSYRRGGAGADGRFPEASLCIGCK